MNKKIKTTAVVLAAGILGIAAVYGASFQKLPVVSHITTGDVNISIKEYTRKGEEETVYKPSKTVLPGTEISKIPRIINHAMPCWVRTRLVFNNSREELDGLNEESIQGISDKWVKRGEYYYYTEILKEAGTADIFQKVVIPSGWDEEHADQKLGIEIQAEAIQAANFTPDFQAMSPWGNQTIQKCVHEQNGIVLKKQNNKALAVKFDGKANELMAVPGDFFANFGSVMPGDRLEDTILISNTSQKEREIWFRTSVAGRNKEQKQMLKDIKLKIYLDKKLMFRGTLDSASLEKKSHSLGIYEKGQKGKLKFIIEIPKKWDNERALKNTDVTWIFAVEKEESIPGNGKYQGSKEEYGNSAEQKNTGAYRKKSVKTGDTSPVEAFTVILLLSVGAAFVVWIRKGGRRA